LIQFSNSVDVAELSIMKPIWFTAALHRTTVLLFSSASARTLLNRDNSITVTTLYETTSNSAVKQLNTRQQYHYPARVLFFFYSVSAVKAVLSLNINCVLNPSSYDSCTKFQDISEDLQYSELKSSRPLSWCFTVHFWSLTVCGDYELWSR